MYSNNAFNAENNRYNIPYNLMGADNMTLQLGDLGSEEVLEAYYMLNQEIGYTREKIAELYHDLGEEKKHQVRLHLAEMNNLYRQISILDRKEHKELLKNIKVDVDVVAQLRKEASDVEAMIKDNYPIASEELVKLNGWLFHYKRRCLELGEFTDKVPVEPSIRSMLPGRR